MRTLFAVVLLTAVAGCGGSVGGGSYTDKALAEYRAGRTYDGREKGKPPTAKDVAVVQKRIKSVKAGSRNDLYQALWLLSNQREHEELHFNTLAKSSYLRESYKRVFGPPDDSNIKEEPNTWSHVCSDGKVTLRGYWKAKSEPDIIMTFPHKPKS